MVKSDHHYRRYLKFIEALKHQKLSGYSEVHHVVPRSLGGSDDADNLIRLTARQHYVAHWMLWKAIGGVAGRSGIKAVANAVANAEANDADEPPKP